MSSRGRRVSRLAAAALLVLAAGSVWAVPVLFDAPPDVEETYVEGSGVAVEVETSHEHPMLLWHDESSSAPICSVMGPDGQKLAQTAVSDGPRRSSGSAGDWVGAATFVASADNVIISCRGPGRPPIGALVTAEPASVSGPVLLGASIVTPLFLATLALALWTGTARRRL